MGVLYRSILTSLNYPWRTRDSGVDRVSLSTSLVGTLKSVFSFITKTLTPLFETEVETKVVPLHWNFLNNSPQANIG